jgi:hypothetical protein
MGALKEAIDPASTGVAVVGGKGATSRETPDEIDTTVIDLSTGTRERLKRTSRLSAAVDNGCVQDAFTLYQHTMTITETGDWCVVQQGMNDATARRYHWASDGLDSFVEEPQTAICSQAEAADPLDLTAQESAEIRAISVDLVQDDPVHLKNELQGQHSLTDFANGAPRRTSSSLADAAAELETTPTLELPDHHELRDSDLSEPALDQLQQAYEYQPEDFEALVELEGIGPGSLRALALIAELVYDVESSREDPAKYAYAHGGKDGTPHPVDRERYDRSIEYLRSTVEGAELDRETKQASLKRMAALG